LTTEYFATVVFRPHTRSVHYSELALEGLGPGLRTSGQIRPEARSLKPEADERQFPGFLWSSY
jgi:hypothetical protein